MNGIYRDAAMGLYGPPDGACKCEPDSGCPGRPKGRNSCFVPGHDRRFAVNHSYLDLFAR